MITHLNEKEKQELSKFLEALNENYSWAAPFVCLGYGDTFQKLERNENDSRAFKGLAYAWADIEYVNINDDQDIDYWEGSDETSVYFAPQNSKIAEINPNAFKGKSKGTVEITKFVL
jgi:hypothetical protein